MQQENMFTNAQEKGVSEQVPQPFSSANIERINILNAKFESPENTVGKAVSGPEASDQFEGSKIFTFEKDGVPVRYAVRPDGNGGLDGSAFRLQRKQQSANGESWVDCSDGMHNLDTGNQNSSEYRIPFTQRMSEAEIIAIKRILGNKI